MSKAVATSEELKLFKSFNLSYTMEVVRWCIKHKVSMDELRIYEGKDGDFEDKLIKLIQVGTPNLSEDEAWTIILTWGKAKYDLKLLHFLAVQEAKDAGFFTKKSTMQILDTIAEKNVDSTADVWQIVGQEALNSYKMIQGMQDVIAK